MQFGDPYDAAVLPSTPGDPAAAQAGAALGDPLVTDLPERVELCDTDADGHPDTVVLSGPGAGTLLLTDVAGDGSADVATRIGADGTVTVAQRDPDDGWTIVEHRGLGADRPDSGQHATPRGGATGHASAGWAGAGTAEAGLPPVVVDPATGEWIEI